VAKIGKNEIPDFLITGSGARSIQNSFDKKNVIYAGKRIFLVFLNWLIKNLFYIQKKGS
jgi:hypothetical protein